MGVTIIQWLGSGLFVAGTSTLGIKLADRFRDRPRELRELGSLLRALSAEITYARTPLAEALERSCLAVERQGPVRELFMQVANQLRVPGSVLQTVWSDAVQHCVRNTALSREDWAIVLALGQTLGQTGATEQQGALLTSVQLLADREREAIIERDKYARIYTTVGVLTGALVVIFFL